MTDEEPKIKFGSKSGIGNMVGEIMEAMKEKGSCPKCGSKLKFVCPSCNEIKRRETKDDG